MKKIFFIFTVFIFLFFTLPVLKIFTVGQASAAIQINSGDIVINEIMQNPDIVSDSYGEWFEVYNPAANIIDLQGCTIKDNDVDSHIISTSTPLIISSHGFAVLARNSDSAQNGGITPDYVYSNFILGNTDDEIIIICNGQEINRVEYDGGTAFPDPIGKSMNFIHPSLANNRGANWCEAISSYGAGDLGTPGLPNDSCLGQPINALKVCKYQDLDGNIQTIDDQTILTGWDFDLGQNLATTTRYTYPDGCVFFETLAPGLYDLKEKIKTGWYRIYPSGPVEIEIISAAPSKIINFYNALAASISGYKYQDLDNNTSTQDWQILSGWNLNLFNGLATTTVPTNQSGFYEFANLPAGDYYLSEILLPDWVQLQSPVEAIALAPGQLSSNNNFINYYPPPQPVCGNSQIETGETCDDGNIQNSDGCSSTCQTEQTAPVCGNGQIEAGEECDDGNIQPGDGCSDSCAAETIESAEAPAPTGGGGALLPLTIFSANQELKIINNNAYVINWLTNYFSSSQIIYSSAGQLHALDLNDNVGVPPKYGYAETTPELDVDQKVTYHTVTLTNLLPQTVYYYRTVSRASPPAFSQEYSFTTGSFPSLASVNVQAENQAGAGQQPGSDFGANQTAPVPPPALNAKETPTVSGISISKTLASGQEISGTDESPNQKDINSQPTNPKEVNQSDRIQKVETEKPEVLGAEIDKTKKNLLNRFWASKYANWLIWLINIILFFTVLKNRRKS